MVKVNLNNIAHFTAIFGDPDGPPAKDRVEDCRYIPYRGWTNTEAVKKSDLILLYCARSYGQYYREAPGIGVVIEVNIPSILYCYLPLEQTISLDTIRNHCTEADKNEFTHMHGKTIISIEGESFRSILTGRQINWP